MSNVQAQTQIKTLRLTNVKGDAYFDLEEIFVALHIYEDIFLPFKSGKIVLQDTNDLQVLLPIIGGEKLEVLYMTPNDKKPVPYTFRIYKMDKDVKPSEKTGDVKLVVLYFVSEEQLIDTRTSISKAFNAKADAIINQLLKNYLKSHKKVDFDSTDNPVKFTANFWTPSKIIQFLSRSSAKGNFSDFVFFEDKEGFKFKSVSQLMEEKPIGSLEFVDDLETKYDYTKIQRYTLSKYFDLLTTAKNGGFGNTVFKFDNERYKFTKEEEDFESITQYGTTLGHNVQFHEEFLSHPGVITTFKDNRHIAKRDQFLKALDKYHMVINLAGDSTKTIGQVYNIRIRTKQREKKDENELLSGTWFVTNVKHEIARSGIYTQNIKCVKNAFFKTNYTNKVKGKKNL